jgi:uncharacterized protein YcaQ
VHGYFCLPILYGDRFIGRMDCKAKHSTGEFTIQQLWLEDGFTPTDVFLKALVKSVNDFAEFNNCESVKLVKSNLNKLPERSLKDLLRK